MPISRLARSSKISTWRNQSSPNNIAFTSSLLFFLVIHHDKFLCLVSRRGTMHFDRPGQVQYWQSLNIATYLDLSLMQNVCLWLLQDVVFRSVASGRVARTTTTYTFRLDGSHSAPICDPGSCEPNQGRTAEGPCTSPTAAIHFVDHVFVTLEAAKGNEVNLWPPAVLVNMTTAINEKIQAHLEENRFEHLQLPAMYLDVNSEKNATLWGQDENSGEIKN